jgi:hypothetical protein
MPCPHGRQRSTCKDCGGKGIYENGRVRRICKECGGAGICEHGRQRYQCKECGGKGICGRGCKECGPYFTGVRGGPVDLRYGRKPL